MTIIDEVLAALESEDHVMLATIIATSGSTPASALSKMLVKEGGAVSVGSVGGGCMEGDVLLHANRLYGGCRAEILTFELTEDDVEHGLVCGGSLDVLIEPVVQSDAPLFRQLKTICDRGDDAVLITRLRSDGIVQEKRVNVVSPTHDVGKAESSTVDGHSAALESSIVRAHHRRQIVRIKIENAELILEPIAGTPQLVIFGGGHVSKYLSRTASMAGFRVSIVDDREKYANPRRFPEAAHTFVLPFETAVGQLGITDSTYVVIVTRGHGYDEEILEQVLTTNAKYVGMIGSRRKILAAYEHLMQRGATMEKLHRVHAPVGLEISAVTAEEIAVSIVAELIHLRRGGVGTPRHKSEAMNELFDLLIHRTPV